MDIKRFTQIFNKITDNVNTVIHGKDDVVRLSMVAICAGGHILFEDVPGVGKSMLAIALGRSMQADTSRVQCTPDMLPGDITGSSIIDTKTMAFSFRPGPVFANVLLVDEINRATPKTQSALLEAMGRRPSRSTAPPTSCQPFIVLATQNPVELAGTFPLPEAQLDRFLFKLTMGYPAYEAERLVMRGNVKGLEVDQLEPVISAKEVMEMIDLTAEVTLTSAIESYILDITHASRADGALSLGAGPRASIALGRASRVMAASDGRDTVYPEDVKVLLRPVLGHRIMLTPDAVLRGETVDDVVDRVLSRVKAPLGIKARAAETSSSPSEPASPASPRQRARRERAGAPTGAP